MTGKTVLALVAAALVSIFAGAPALADGQYDPGASDESIKIGNTNPYSGPASPYGTIGKTIAAYFDMVNAEGGINGRRIDFISLDDGYSPPKTVEQVRKLVEQEEVLLLFNLLGTPTNTAVHRYVNAKKIPHLFLATGASKFGQPEKFPWTMGFAPTYSTEGKAFAKYVMANVDDPKVGVLFQNDDYGKDFLDGFKAGLGDLADKVIIAEEAYEVTDPTVDSQIVSLKASGANVFYSITGAKQAAQAIRKAHDIGWRPLYLLNYVATSKRAVLEPAGLAKAKGIISAQFLKDPNDPGEDVKAYRAFMEKYYSNGDPDEGFNTYGYAVAYTMVHVLELAGDNLTRANIMKQAASIDKLVVPMLVDGITVSTGPDDFYPLETLVLIRFDGENWIPFGEPITTE